MNWVAATEGLLAALVIGFATWLLSVWRRDVSIVDSAWSLMILAAAGIYAVRGPGPGAAGTLVLVLVAVWALRLSVHLTWRNFGEPEDRRYAEIRTRYEPGFAYKSLYLVFGFQALLAWIVSAPLFAALSAPWSPGWLSVAGATLWLTGFAFETVADWQLGRFRAAGGNHGRVLDRGLWRYSRHPNYFGECVLWWGLYLFALDAGAWWSVVSPLLMTWLLLRFSGVTLLERDISDRRPEYADYARRTNAFFPGPTRSPRRVSA